MSSEEKEAEIIRVVYSKPYSHAEVILGRLHYLQGQMSHQEAIDVIHSEVVADQALSGDR